MKFFFLIILGYVMGSIPFGYLLVKRKRGMDVREVGSGSTGATNVTRAVGMLGGVATLALDAAKGYAPVYLALRFGSGESGTAAMTAVAVILGHVFPIFLKFRGGKGVATGLGAFLVIAPQPILAGVAVFVLVVALSRYVSLGSIVAAASLPVFSVLFGMRDLVLLSAMTASALIIIFKHYTNIQRLLRGSENRLAGFSKHQAS